MNGIVKELPNTQKRFCLLKDNRDKTMPDEFKRGWECRAIEEYLFTHKPEKMMFIMSQRAVDLSREIAEYYGYRMEIREKMVLGEIQDLQVMVEKIK